MVPRRHAGPNHDRGRRRGARRRRVRRCDGAATYRFHAAETSAPALTLDAASAVLPRQVAAFCVGTLGLVLEPMASTLEAPVHRMGDDTLVTLRPELPALDHPGPDRLPRRLDRLLPRADVIKASNDELAWLYYPGRDARDAARAMLAQRDAVALVTLGADGAPIVAAPEPPGSRRRTSRSSTPSGPAIRSSGRSSRPGERAAWDARSSLAAMSSSMQRGSRRAQPP